MELKTVLLDTNFIIACVKNNVDFFESLKLRGFDVVIPVEVIHEIEELAKTEKYHDKQAIGVAIQLIKNRGIRKISLKEDNVDEGIIKYAEKNKNTIIATLDKELKKRLKDKARIITLKARKIIDFE